MKDDDNSELVHVISKTEELGVVSLDFYYELKVIIRILISMCLCLISQRIENEMMLR